ncbi:hypothetical protein JHK82_043325 [Glycine max]|nr:hypothetical protein JHK82_043325 [Glycine max]
MCESKSEQRHDDKEKQTEELGGVLTRRSTIMWDVIGEAKSLWELAFPTALTGLIFYARSMVSMLFLGHLGDTELAQRPKLLSLTLQRCVIFLLFSSIPISLLWLNMSKVLSYSTNTHTSPKMAQTYLVFLPPRPRHQLLPPPNQSLPSRPERHPPCHVSVPRRHPPPRSIQLLVSAACGVAAASAASSFSILVAGSLRVDKWGPPHP